MTTTKLARHLTFDDIGKRVNSLVYRDKNKTTRPSPKRDYTLDSLSLWANGTIKINQSYNLRPDTVVEFLDESE